MNSVNSSKNLDCSHVKQRLDDFLSDELAIEATREILTHLQECRDCSREKSLREQIRAALRRSWDAQSAPAALHESVLNSTVDKRRGRSFIYLRIAAAVLVMMVGLTAYVALFSNNRTSTTGVAATTVNHYEEVAADHLRCNGHPAKSPDLPLAGVVNRVSAILGQTESRYAPVGVMECRVGDVSFTHYLFRGDEGLLSLMVADRNETEHLPDLGKTVSVDGADMQTVQQGPLVVGGLETPRHFLYILADNSGSDETVRIARMLLPSIRASLWNLG